MSGEWLKFEPGELGPERPDENGIYPWGDRIPWPPEADLDYE